MKIEWKIKGMTMDEVPVPVEEEKLASELTAREHALILYRCAAVAGAVIAVKDTIYFNAEQCDMMAQAMLELDDPEAEKK